MKRVLFSLTLIFASLGLSQSKAEANIITFSGVSTVPFTPGPYVEAGMTVTGSPNLWAWPSAGQLHLDPASFGTNPTTFTFGGNPFDLQSVAITFSSSGAFAEFIGYDASNNVVAMLSEPASTNHTVNFSGFNNITKLVLVDHGNHFSIDNLTFTPSAPAAPEPTSLAVFGLAALAAGGYGWRRRKLAAAA